MNKLLEKIILRYKSIDFINNVQYIEADVSAKGLAFILKQREYFTSAKLYMRVDKPYCKITPIGKEKNITAVLDGNDVWLEDENGTILKKRVNARDKFSSFRHNLYWDDLDMAYFANYAFWNYFTFPALLINPYIHWKQTGENTLEATFFDDVPTHSKVQQFHFDDEGFLLRHDYTADVISSLATAANKVIEHKNVDDFLFTSKRIVTPRFDKTILNKPVLIDIDVHNINLILRK